MLQFLCKSPFSEMAPPLVFILVLCRCRLLDRFGFRQVLPGIENIVTAGAASLAARGPQLYFVGFE